MKKITLFLLFIFSISSKAQSPVINLFERTSPRINNAYYKDTDNILNKFVGTWLYTNGSTSLKISIVKKTMVSMGRYYEDKLIGEYQYIVNGVTKVNTLPNLSQNVSHAIEGNAVHPGKFNNPLCDYCDPNEREVANLRMEDPVKDMLAHIYLKRENINGFESLSIYIYPNAFMSNEVRTDWTFSVSPGYYTLRLQ